MRLFFSYNSKNQALVDSARKIISARGHDVFMDRYDIEISDSWVKRIESELSDSFAFLVFISPEGIGNWQAKEILKILNDHESQAWKKVIPIVQTTQNKGILQPLPWILADKQWLEFSDLTDTTDFAYTKLFRALDEIKSPQPLQKSGKNPYRGLSSYEVEEAPFFFGRTYHLNQAFNNKLRFHLSIKDHNFLAIIADSGVGKSSFAKAGILAALKNQRFKDSEKWKQILIKPGNEPLAALSSALKINGLIPDSRKFEEDAKKYNDQLKRTIRDQQETVVLFIDQFEEVLTQCKDDAIRNAFLLNLANAHNFEKVIILLTLRSDFYTGFGKHEAFKNLLESHNYTLPPIQLEENNFETTAHVLRSIIRDPAHLQGVEIEKGLVDRIILDLKNVSGSLPFLQMAMYRLWEIKGEKSKIQVIDYDTLTGNKGMAGLINSHLEKTFQEITNGDKKKIELIRRIFILHLVELTNNKQDVRRTVPKNEALLIDGYQREEVEAMILSLSAEKTRIIQLSGTGDDSKVEVVHEVIIREWTLLKSWINEKRESLEFLETIRQDSKKFAAGKGEFYSGKELKNAKQWALMNPDLLSEDIKTFLKTAQKVRENNIINVGVGSLALLILIPLAVVLYQKWNFEKERNEYITDILPSIPTLYSQFQLSDLDGDPSKINYLRIDKDNFRSIKKFLELNPKIKHFTHLIITTDLDIDYFKERDEFDQLSFIHLENVSTLEFLNGFRKKTSLNTVVLERIDTSIGLREIEKFPNVKSLVLSNLSWLNSLDDLDLDVDLESLTIRGIMELENLKGIGKFGNIKALEVNYNSQLHDLGGIEFLKGLKSLKICNNEFLKNTNGISNLLNIKHISISNNNDLNGINGLENLSNLESIVLTDNPKLEGITTQDLPKNLRCLEVSRNENLQYLIGVEHLKNLTKLEIKDNPILNQISNINKLKGLQILIIRGNDDLKLKELKYPEMVRSLEISWNDYHDYIEEIKLLKNLTGLRITYPAYSIDTLIGFEDLKGIRSLEISSNTKTINLPRISDLEDIQSLSFKNISLKNVAGIGDLKHLRYLNLSEVYFFWNTTDFTDFEKVQRLDTLVLRSNANIKVLHALKSVKGLVSIDISLKNQIEDLSVFKSFPYLKSLSIVIYDENDLELLNRNKKELPAFTKLSLDYYSKLDSLILLNFNGFHH